MAGGAGKIPRIPEEAGGPGDFRRKLVEDAQHLRGQEGQRNRKGRRLYQPVRLAAQRDCIQARRCHGCVPGAQYPAQGAGGRAGGEKASLHHPLRSGAERIRGGLRRCTVCKDEIRHRRLQGVLGQEPSERPGRHPRGGNLHPEYVLGAGDFRHPGQQVPVPDPDGGHGDPDGGIPGAAGHPDGGQELPGGVPDRREGHPGIQVPGGGGVLPQNRAQRETDSALLQVRRGDGIVRNGE